QLSGPSGGRGRAADLGAAGGRATPGYACRDEDRSARHSLPLDRLSPRAARAGTRERHRCAQRRPYRGDPAALRPHGRRDLSGADKSAAASIGGSPAAAVTAVSDGASDLSFAWLVFAKPFKSVHASQDEDGAA